MVSLLILLWWFAKEAHSQSDEVIPSQSGDLAYLEKAKASVLYKDPVAEKIAHDIWRAEKLRGTRQGQCVIAVRTFTGRSDIRGIARNIPVNSDKPAIGAVIKLNESKSGHVGVVIDIRGSEIYIYESNFGYTERATTRWLSVSDPRIVGYNINGKELIYAQSRQSQSAIHQSQEDG